MITTECAKASAHTSLKPLRELFAGSFVSRKELMQHWLAAFLDQAGVPTLVLALAMMSQLEVGTTRERALYERGRQTIEVQNGNLSRTSTDPEWPAGLPEQASRSR